MQDKIYSFTIFFHSGQHFCSQHAYPLKLGNTSEKKLKTKLPD